MKIPVTKAFVYGFRLIFYEKIINKLQIKLFTQLFIGNMKIF